MAGLDCPCFTTSIKTVQVFLIANLLLVPQSQNIPTVYSHDTEPSKKEIYK